ncbi:DUF317 domain-containing protein [Streptomyces albospinus]|uniref:DUF317 domain-containing protein n=1 Tax=Streptomyces albospinus TaxID=285515 RepID=UPI001E455471|nr:DUF317 domain-containing protein [Streptomyces albospinus]
MPRTRSAYRTGSPPSTATPPERSWRPSRTRSSPGCRTTSPTTSAAARTTPDTRPPPCFPVITGRPSAARGRSGWFRPTVTPPTGYAAAGSTNTTSSSTRRTWRMSAGPDPISKPSWQAYFSRGTPEHLITASAVALTDPTPVTRAADLIPDRHRSLVEILPVQRSLTPRTEAALARSPHTESIQPLQLPAAGATPLAPRAIGSRRQR